MSTYSNTGESFASNLLTGAIIAASAFMLYAAVALPQAHSSVQTAPAAPAAIEQVVVTAPGHVS